MRQHRLSLCVDHFLDWLPDQTERSIRKYEMFSKYDRILVAVSGGKDSLALWDILQRLGYDTEGIYIDLGIVEGIKYSSKSQQFSEKFADGRELKLHVVNVKTQYGKSIPDFTKKDKRGKDKPCSVCGVVKRHIMNNHAVRYGFNVLVTAHNLDDEAAVLLSNTLSWSLDFLARGQPVLTAAAGFARKAKPFCRVYERESAAYAFLRGIQFVHDECPFSAGSKQLFFKKHLNEWEEKMPGTKLRFYGNYLKALDNGSFSSKRQVPEEMAANKCPNCGQPTTTGGLCAFCRLFS
jgi:uncharacterized protein (TIGR00269 family)